VAKGEELYFAAGRVSPLGKRGAKHLGTRKKRKWTEEGVSSPSFWWMSQKNQEEDVVSHEKKKGKSAINGQKKTGETATGEEGSFQ